MNKKGIIFASVIIMLIAVASLYVTYAIDATEEESASIEYDLSFDFDLSGSITNEKTIKAGETKFFDFDITNSYDDVVQYGVSYTLISPVSLPDDVIIAEHLSSKNSAVGNINASSTISVTIIVVNESASDVTLSFSIINGYKNGGDLSEIVPEGSNLIEGVYPISPSYATLTNLGLTELLNEGEPDFSTIATTDEGIYGAEDDLGTSYYFRGASTNNYVYFAGFYWRIIRINGDGTIRMIYDGTSKHDNGESSTDRQVAVSAYNEGESNAYVGYMYGSPDATTYEETHDNINDSIIKDYLENTWYANNIKNTSYESYVADAIYCNDRSVDPVDTEAGILYNDTFYNAINRFYESNPTLICQNVNDRFTKEGSSIETVDAQGTNKKLKYSIGIITADEIGMAGAAFMEYSNSPNTSFYLYSGNGYHTMTPGSMDSGILWTFSFDDDAILGYYYGVNWEFGVRPVISLNADALRYSETSNGTKDYPFVVAE